MSTIGWVKFHASIKISSSIYHIYTREHVENCPRWQNTNTIGAVVGFKNGANALVVKLGVASYFQEGYQLLLLLSPRHFLIRVLLLQIRLWEEFDDQWIADHPSTPHHGLLPAHVPHLLPIDPLFPRRTNHRHMWVRTRRGTGGRNVGNRRRLTIQASCRSMMILD